jgi:hypothetical protein
MGQKRKIKKAKLSCSGLEQDRKCVISKISKEGNNGPIIKSRERNKQYGARNDQSTILCALLYNKHKF